MALDVELTRSLDMMTMAEIGRKLRDPVFAPAWMALVEAFRQELSHPESEKVEEADRQARMAFAGAMRDVQPKERALAAAALLKAAELAAST